MGKNFVRGCIVLAIIFVMFSIIAFAAPFKMTAAFWIAYVFGVIAIAGQLYVFKVAFAYGEDVKSRFYGFPIAKVGVIYLVLQLVLSLIEMVTAFVIPGWVALMLDIILVAITMVGCISADAMREEIAKQDVKIKKNVNNIRELQSLSASLPGMCTDEGLEKELQVLADEFRFSDPVSSDVTLEIENELNVLTKELQRAIVEGDFSCASVLCKKLKSGLAERNRICTVNK